MARRRVASSPPWRASEMTKAAEEKEEEEAEPMAVICYRLDPQPTAKR